MDYIGVKQAAKKWNITERQVQNYCAEGRILGAEKIGKQWLIPAEASVPGDRRTKKGRTIPVNAHYRFPLLTHILIFGDLDEDEKKLYKAESLFLQGKYSDSVKICRALISNCKTIYIQAGAYTTLCFNGLLLGMYSLYRSNCNNLQALIEKDSVHSEDIKLLYASVKHHIGWDSSVYSQIDPLKLSHDAVFYYQSCILTTAIIDREEIPIHTVKVLDTLCLYSDRNNIAPLGITMHAFLANFYGKVGNVDMQKFHIKRSCDFALNNNMLNHLSKYHLFFPALINEYLKKVSPSSIEKMKAFSQRNQGNWRAINAQMANNNDYIKMNPADIDFQILLAYKHSDKDIATILNISESEVRKKVAAEKKRLNIQTRHELAEEIFKIFQEIMTKASENEKY